MVAFIVSAINWQFVGPEGGDLVEVSANGNKVLTVGIPAIYFSSDGGNTWQRVMDWSNFSGIGFFGALKPIVGQNNCMLIHSTGILYSTDCINYNQTSLPAGEQIVYVSDNPSDTVFLVVQTPTVMKLYLTTDGGANLTNIYTVSSIDTAILAVAFQGSTIYMLMLDNVNNVSSIYFSNDFGNTWTATPTSITFTGASDMEIDPADPQHIFLVAGQNLLGIYESSDGGATFSQINSIFSGVLFPLDVEVISSTEVLVASYVGAGIFKGTKNLLGIWNFNQTFSDEIVFSIEGNYGATFGGGIVHTNDNGNTWTYRNNGLYAYFLYNPSAFSNTRTDQLAFISLGGKTFYTTDGGTTWNNYNINLDMGFALEFAPNNPNIVFVSGFRNNVSTFSSDVFFKSTDGGNTFSTLETYGFTENPFDSIYINIQVGSNENDVFVINNLNHFKFSNDGGNTFSRVDSMPPTAFCYACLDTLVVLSLDTLYISYDAGNTWNKLTYIPHTGTFYITRHANSILYTTGTNALVYTYDISTGTLDSLDFSAEFDTLYQVEVGLTGLFFIAGVQAGTPKLGYGTTLNSLFYENLPALGAIVPLNTYIFLVDPLTSGIWVGNTPVSLKEASSRSVSVVYMPNGVKFEGADVLEVYTLEGRFIKRKKGNFISRNELPSGIYIIKHGKGMNKVIIR